MDGLMGLLGASPVPWSYKTDCCGGSLVLSRKDIVLDLTAKLHRNAIEGGRGGDRRRLSPMPVEPRYQAGGACLPDTPYHVPVLYFTEMIGLAFGLKDAARWLKRHFVDPTNLLASKGLVNEVTFG